jgi:DNA (cytosine-5)-methyltransferase 1
MRLLDLFCGAGGAAMGYHRAGFTEIVGVDLRPQPNYPFTFVQADAMTYPLDGFDAIHASPPCQEYSWSSAKHRNKGKQYPDLLQPTRERLRGRTFVIENVVGAGRLMPMAFTLCGSMFNLGVQRHRLFEVSELIWVPPHPVCSLSDADVVSVTGHGPPGRWYRRCTGAGHGGHGPHFSLAVWKESMGIDWMTRDELTQSIPPAYTEYIGRQLIEVCRRPREDDEWAIA